MIPTNVSSNGTTTATRVSRRADRDLIDGAETYSDPKNIIKAITTAIFAFSGELVE